MGEVQIINNALSTATVLDLFASGDIHSTKFSIKSQDPAEVAARIAERDLNATSLDELLGGGTDAISGKNYLNRPFQVNSVEWQLSDIEGEGLPFYAVIHGVSLEGEVLVITCGASTVVRKLAVMASNEWLPAWVKIVQDKVTANGYKPLDLVKAAQSEIPFAG